MLLENFFKIIQVDALAPQHFRVLVALITGHPVYEGHFPGNPVVPGVCTLQMVVECAGIALGFSVVMVQASVVKFLDVVQPATDKELEIDLQTDDVMAVKATVKSGERIVMSCKIKLKKNDF